MSLRLRLTLYFVAIVVLPLLGVSLYVRYELVRTAEAHTAARLDLTRQAAVATLDAERVHLAEVINAVARDPALQRALARGDRAAVRGALERLGTGKVALVVTGRAGDVLAEQGPIPSFLAGYAPTASEALAAPAGTPVRALLWHRYATVQAGGCHADACAIGSVSAGVWLDSVKLAELKAIDPASDLTVLVDGEAWASTLPASQARQLARELGRSGTVTLGQERVMVRSGPLSAAAGEGAILAVSTAAAAAGVARVNALVALLLVLATGVVVLLGATLARLVSRPLRELSAQVRAIASGNLEGAPGSVESADEVGELARVFDQLRVELRGYLRALQASRDELARSMARLGETLSSTHDLPKLLTVVLEAAVQARQARAGSLMLINPERSELVPRVAYGLSVREMTRAIPLGEGIAGTVGLTGVPAVVPGPDRNLVRSPLEPAAGTQVTVPLRSHGQILGVLNLYDRETPEPFAVEDAEALATFAVQAAVGIENIQLHAEAQRLSLTDPLTGIWNYRYFERRYQQELDRCSRFNRVFALLLLDVDHFKEINDRCGHQRGDDVLVELARRVRSIVRDIDTFARYGGEEFVLILPETRQAGALEVAERIRAAVSSGTFGRPDEAPLRVTVSIGVACYPDHGPTTRELLRAADEALYEAKLQGRNRVVLAGLARQAGQEPGEPVRLGTAEPGSAPPLR